MISLRPWKVEHDVDASAVLDANHACIVDDLDADEADLIVAAVNTYQAHADPQGVRELVAMQDELLGAYTHEIRAVMEWCRGERPYYDVATMEKVMEQLLNAPLVSKIKQARAHLEGGK